MIKYPTFNNQVQIRRIHVGNRRIYYPIVMKSAVTRFIRFYFGDYWPGTDDWVVSKTSPTRITDCFEEYHTDNIKYDLSIFEKNLTTQK